MVYYSLFTCLLQLATNIAKLVPSSNAMLASITGSVDKSISLAHDGLDLGFSQSTVKDGDIVSNRSEVGNLACWVTRLDIDHMRHQLVVDSGVLDRIHDIEVIVVHIQHRLNNVVVVVFFTPNGENNGNAHHAKRRGREKKERLNQEGEERREKREEGSKGEQ